MNKKLISLAVAAAVAAPMAVSADTTLYGKVNNSLMYTDATLKYSYAEYIDGDLDYSERGSESGDNWDVEDYSSRIGVKGSEDLGNGMKAIYQIELQMETADGGSTSRPVDGFGTRLGFVGVTGGFGTVAVGRQWTPYYGSVDKTDIFPVDLTNEAYMGATRTGNAVAYVSPDMGGFSVSGALIVDGSSYSSESFTDAFNLSADYNNGPISVGASYFSDENADRNQWGLAGSYSFGMFKIIGQYEDGDVGPGSVAKAIVGPTGLVDGDDLDDWGDEIDAFTDGSGDGSSWAIAGQATFGNNVISVKYGERDADGSVTDPDMMAPGKYSANMDLEEWVLSWEHNLSKRTKVFAVYDNTETTGTLRYTDGIYSERESVNSESDRFGIGIQHLF